MKAIVLDKPFANEEEYFLFEEKSELKHEYINGTLFEMSGASKFHNRLRRKIANLLDQLINSDKFEVYDEGFKLRTPDGNFFYPDVLVCLTNPAFYYTDKPVLLVEVLSISTRRFDLSDKFIQYSKLDTLEYYLCVEPQKKLIYFFYRDESNEWVTDEPYTEDTDIIHLPKLNISLAVKDIYTT